MIDAVELEQELRQRDPLAAREPGCGLVEHHQRRVRAARHADLELALLAVRERADERLLAALEADEAGELGRALAELAVALAQDDRAQMALLDAEDREVEVVDDRQAEKRAGLLVGAAHPELGPGAGWQERDVDARGTRSSPSSAGRRPR